MGTETQEAALKIVPLTGSTGAEVWDVDLNTADARVVDEISRITSQFCVTVLRDQFLDPAAVARIGQMFGTPMVNPILNHDHEVPFLWQIANHGKANARTEMWHTDATYCSPPPSYTFLSAATVPPAGGDTIIVNQYESFARLSDAYKALLLPLEVLHATPPGRDPAMSAIHPLVRRHPLTQRACLYVNPALDLAIIGMSAEESCSIIGFLNAHSVHIDRMYRHRWLPGDVLVWDNRCTLHAAVHDYGDAERTLYRVIVEGESPVAAITR